MRHHRADEGQALVVDRFGGVELEQPECSSPLLKADSATIAFSADGSLRVRYAGWENW
jgi:hypothetical protein